MSFPGFNDEDDEEIPEAPSLRRPSSGAPPPAPEQPAPAQPAHQPAQPERPEPEYHDPYGATPDSDPYGEGEEELPPLYPEGRSRLAAPLWLQSPKVWVPLLLAVIVLLWLVGGSGHKKHPRASTTTQTPTTKPTKTTSTAPRTKPAAASAALVRFRRQADSVCAAEHSRSGVLARSFARAKSAPAQAAVLARAVALYSQSQRRLTAFKAPQAKAALYHAWLAQTAATLAIMRHEVTAIRGHRVKAAEALDRRASAHDRSARSLARRLGFHVCGR